MFYGEKNDESGTRLNTADLFNEFMMKSSPEWKLAMEEKKEITLTLFVCNVASKEYIDDLSWNLIKTKEPIAYRISKAFPNVTVIAPDGYVGYKGDKIYGVENSFQGYATFLVIKDGIPIRRFKL